MRRRGRPIRTDWLAVVPVKPLPGAKTRLRGAVPDAIHPELVLAMAQDTVAAVLACVPVLVVCDDPRIDAAVTALGARCVPDRPDAGLNAALAFGAAGWRGPVAALTADLPALRPVELAAALRAAATFQGRGYLPDAAGTGTVLLTALTGDELSPRFGVGSAAAHRASGARRLDGDWPGLRRDVDTGADLAEAKVLGLGSYTETLLCSAPHPR